MLDLHIHELLARVAYMYYEQEMTQSEIADELGLSRIKVHRLLRESRERDIVHITIDWPIRRDDTLEAALEKMFGLQTARVFTTGYDQPMTDLRMIGHLCARFMEDLLVDISRFAICWGRSTYEVVNAIRPGLRANIQIVQAVGTIPHSREDFDSSMLARQLAKKVGGQVLYLTSPLIADSANAAEVIRNQRSIQHTLAMASSADIALVGIGHLDPQTCSFVREGMMTERELQAAIDDGAVGDVAWRIFTSSGDLYPCALNDLIIGITIEDLRQIPMTIGVASGLNKARAIAGALRTQAINVLCTDDKTARAILELT
jgi:DNA-binding transcriptional regulator LsrR (DeoR family)